MATDYRVEFDFPDHPKTRRLIRACGADGVLALMRLWAFAGRYRAKGVLYDMSCEDIAIAARWPSEPATAAKFVEALLESGFLDKTTDSIHVLHDWEEHNPYLFHREERSLRAKHAAQSRWGKDLADAPGTKRHNAPSPTPTPSPDPTPFPKEQYMTWFNESCPSLPQVLNIKGMRLDHLKKRVAENPKLDWKAFFDRIEASDWLSGRVWKW